MSNINKLFELADELNNSASGEGCDPDLMVVGSAQLSDLLQFVRLLKASQEGQKLSGQTDAKNICQRLLDSEEHVGDAAIPDVAEDAVEVINRLSTGLKATQEALSQAMQYSEKAHKFVEEIAGLSIWDYDKNDGTPYEECEEPGDGYLDSHSCLMESIEEARKILDAEKLTSTKEVFRGYFGFEGTTIEVDFEAPAGATVAEKDAAFMAALAQKADIDYLAISI